MIWTIFWPIALLKFMNSHERVIRVPKKLKKLAEINIEILFCLIWKVGSPDMVWLWRKSQNKLVIKKRDLYYFMLMINFLNIMLNSCRLSFHLAARKSLIQVLPNEWSEPIVGSPTVSQRDIRWDSAHRTESIMKNILRHHISASSIQSLMMIKFGWTDSIGIEQPVFFHRIVFIFLNSHLSIW